ncbi:hypothetical protein [Alteromonas flava]|uniref:hypothetical protein n=1 Tax=Alteromonas flava TaxID=2048003 RepID=UPI000F5E15E2|nr:hypothetical protein [Alteromonas flava]
MKVLLDYADKQADLTVQCITIRLGDETVEKLKAIDAAFQSEERVDKPIEYLGRKLRERVFKKVKATHYWFVVEKSEEEADHIHILVALPNGSESTTRELLKSVFGTGDAGSSLLKPSSIAITNTYTRELYLKYIGDDEGQLRELDAELLANPLWSKVEKKTAAGKVVKYEGVESHGIDIGIADYLAKGTGNNLFESSRYNFSVSSALRKESAQLIEEQLELNKALKRKWKSRPTAEDVAARVREIEEAAREARERTVERNRLRRIKRGLSVK